MNRIRLKIKKIIQFKKNTKDYNHMEIEIPTLINKDSVSKKKQGFYTFIYIILFLIIHPILIGCSDTPYSGSILSIDYVDRYLLGTGEDTLCIQDGFDTVCIKYVCLVEDKHTEITPIIEVHPTDFTYIFHYEGKPILYARSTEDDLDGAAEGWIFQIFYPDTFPEEERGITPENSGFNIIVAEGYQQNIKKDQVLEIQHFIQANRMDETRFLQFLVSTVAREITIHVDGLVPDHKALFYINVDAVLPEEGKNSFQLQPNNL